MKVQEIIYAKKSNFSVLIKDSLPKEVRVLRPKKKNQKTKKKKNTIPTTTVTITTKPTYFTNSAIYSPGQLWKCKLKRDKIYIYIWKNSWNCIVNEYS